MLPHTVAVADWNDQLTLPITRKCDVLPTTHAKYGHFQIDSRNREPSINVANCCQAHHLAELRLKDAGCDLSKLLQHQPQRSSWSISVNTLRGVSPHRASRRRPPAREKFPVVSSDGTNFFSKLKVFPTEKLLNFLLN